MRNTFLEFEQPLAELENKIEQLRYVQADSAVDISDEIGRLQQKSQSLAKEIYAKLTPWQTALVARHPQRPYTPVSYTHLGNGLGQEFRLPLRVAHHLAELLVGGVSNNDFLNFTAPTPNGWGYAVFGTITEGTDVVDKIKGVKTGNKGFHQNVPNEDVIIEKAEVLE